MLFLLGKNKISEILPHYRYFVEHELRNQREKKKRNSKKEIGKGEERQNIKEKGRKAERKNIKEKGKRENRKKEGEMRILNVRGGVGVEKWKIH